MSNNLKLFISVVFTIVCGSLLIWFSFYKDVKYHKMKVENVNKIDSLNHEIHKKDSIIEEYQKLKQIEK